MDTIISARIEQASKITGLSSDSIRELFVSSESIDDNNLIKSVLAVSTVDDIIEAFTLATKHTRPGIGDTVSLPMGKMKAAAVTLTGGECKSEPVQSELPTTSVIEQLLQSNKPIQQWSDAEVLKGYLEDDREELEFELNKRSKGRRFIVLTNLKSEEIDIEATLLMLKRSRKEEIPAYYKVAGSDRPIFVYRIEEYHQTNRVRSESPLKHGIALFDDYCPVSNVNFTGVDLISRQFIRLIVDLVGIYKPEVKQVVEIARDGGIEGLATQYPEVYGEFIKQSNLGTLPTLKLVESVTSSNLTKSDPFNARSSKRTF
jgi:hypothetical protein